MGSELPDAAFYERGGLQGGLAYTPESLRRIFSGLTEIELRRMHDEPSDSPLFGEPFLWTALFHAARRKARLTKGPPGRQTQRAIGSTRASWTGNDRVGNPSRGHASAGGAPAPPAVVSASSLVRQALSVRPCTSRPVRHATACHALPVQIAS